ncbi:hypothetical protein B0T10DRAFT_467207 [Thelonectria olida]|uniref:Uncharacterized protein n=1 Tax=Thelonectria olida TaxID=1576542 RepID=A0A9P9AH00_9HYPO|nr:hypothetical protein B0T10DRAFT_467207 [Thelonectria olida]
MGLFKLNSTFAVRLALQMTGALRRIREAFTKLITSFGGASVPSINTVGYDQYVVVGGIENSGLSPWSNETICTIDLNTDSSSVTPHVVVRVLANGTKTTIANGTDMRRPNSLDLAADEGLCRYPQQLLRRVRPFHYKIWWPRTVPTNNAKGFITKVLDRLVVGDEESAGTGTAAPSVSCSWLLIDASGQLWTDPSEKLTDIRATFFPSPPSPEVFTVCDLSIRHSKKATQHARERNQDGETQAKAFSLRAVIVDTSLSNPISIQQLAKDWGINLDLYAKMSIDAQIAAHMH